MTIYDNISLTSAYLTGDDDSSLTNPEPMTRSAVLAIYLCTLFVAVSAQWHLTFEDCGSPDVTIKNVFVDSDMELGDSAKFTTTGIANKDITGASFTVAATRKFRHLELPLFADEGSICELMGEEPGCIVTEGSEFTLKYKPGILSFASNEEYTMLIRAETEGGWPLGCVRIRVGWDDLDISLSEKKTDGNLGHRRFLDKQP